MAHASWLMPHGSWQSYPFISSFMDNLDNLSLYIFLLKKNLIFFLRYLSLVQFNNQWRVTSIRTPPFNPFFPFFLIISVWRVTLISDKLFE